jgi:serine/threonine protein kinase
MAQLIHSPTGSGPQGPFEQKLVEALLRALPAQFKVLPNFSIKQAGHPALEYDIVVLAPHAVYVVEAKEWYGRLSGDDTEWLINSTPKKCPMWLVEVKCKVLKSRVGPLGADLWYEPMLVVPNDRIEILLGGDWAENVQTVRGAVRFLQDPTRLRRSANILGLHAAVVQRLQGGWAARRRDQPRRIAGYEIAETLAIHDDEAEYLAKRALISDPTPYRIRTWPISPYLSPEDRAAREEVIRRPAEALAAIGRHPNLLEILDFNRLDEENEFYEITEWSDYGTLHGFLKNSERDKLTLRERLEIALGVASALEAVHARGLVHRNVCPETILIDAERRPRLTDFDRAYLARGQTVFAATRGRTKNPAYVPPELEDVTNYRFDAASDMYSFGVLLYELLTDNVPFPGPAAAKAAQGRPDRMPSALREGVDRRLDELIVGLLDVADLHRRPTATAAIAALLEALGSTREAGQQSTAPTPPPPSPPLPVAEGTILNGVYRVDARLGSGAFSRVFKVFHLLQGKTFAMKLLVDENDAQVMLDEYNRIGSRLPRHSNIAEMLWMDRLAPPYNDMYILSEYVEGETLAPYCKGDKKLAWTDIRRIGSELLDALHVMHHVNRGILHRDIKPANILLELPSHRPKLIDFNIASQVVHATGQGGTPRYWAPDRGQPHWRPDMDLFSLGVVLYELVTQRHPFPDDNPLAGTPYDPRVLRRDLRLGEELAGFLLKAVQPKGADRFASASEMREALLAIPSMHAPAAPTPAPARGAKFPEVTLDRSERGKRNYNPYVTRLLTLYSQARRSNSGTRAGLRGLDEIARLTYVPTKLDEALTPAIADGRFRLLIVTGNAGDGKTVYLQKVEQYFRGLGATVNPLPTGNGNRWAHGRLTYETNYDGSQDEEDVENDKVLARFFAPFSGAQLAGLDGGQARLIAINEGRLLDFLEHGASRDDFGGLRRFVKETLDGADPPEGALLVNLNLRAVTAGGRESLVERQLGAMLKPELWAPCQGCDYRLRCPLKHNADSLRDEVNGATVRDRVRRFFEVVHLRRRSHITMRDLRSALSWLLLRDHGCEDVGRMLTRPDEGSGDELAALYYPEAFAHGSGRPERTVDDRLVRLLREADVGFVNSPQLDHHLDHDPDAAVPWMTFEGRSDYARSVLASLTRDTPRSLGEVALPGDARLAELLSRRRTLVSRWRRWAYHERRDDGWQEMTPYRSLRLLEAVTISPDENARLRAGEDLRDRIIDAISLSEGLRSPAIRREYLGLRVSRVKNPSIRGYRLFPCGGFRIEVSAGGRLSEYLEYSADAVSLVASPALGTARLRVSLDLLEMLELIQSGYRPSPADLQGLFVNLLIIRNELLSLPFDRIMVTEDDANFHVILASTGADGDIRLSLADYEAATATAGARP